MKFLKNDCKYKIRSLRVIQLIFDKSTAYIRSILRTKNFSNTLKTFFINYYTTPRVLEITKI